MGCNYESREPHFIEQKSALQRTKLYMVILAPGFGRHLIKIASFAGIPSQLRARAIPQILGIDWQKDPGDPHAQPAL